MEEVILSTLEIFRKSSPEHKPALKIKSNHTSNNGEFIKYETTIRKVMNYYTAHQMTCRRGLYCGEYIETKLISVDINTVRNWAPGHVWAIEYSHENE